MSYLEHSIKRVPTGITKALHVNWALVVLITAVAGIGFLMLYSVAGGDITRWAEPQMKRFTMGVVLMFIIGFVPIWFWRNMAAVFYLGALFLLILIPIVGETRMGAQRWINLGFMTLQPSELAKIALVMMLAAYYDWLDIRKVSHPLWVAIPVALILLPCALVVQQPDLGTALLLMAGGGVVMFAAGVSWMYFVAVITAGIGVISAVFTSRGKSWQLLNDYQYERIDTFLNPSIDPLGAGYNITQAQIALGSGGWAGRGFMQGTQSRLNFLPEKHTDFIFTILAEEFGFVGGFSLLLLYIAIIGFCLVSALGNKDRFASLLTIGVAMTFFLYFALNMAMVMGLVPVVGVPLPLVSYGGSAMMVLLIAFGFVQSAHIHRPR